MLFAGGASAQVVGASDTPDVANTAPASTVAKTQTHTKIRALAVVEFSGDEPISGKYRLVPISVFSNGAYRDGESYLANPVPLSLQNGVIYEVQESGKPLGYATVNRDTQVGQDGARQWYGIGVLQKTAPDAMAKAAPAKITLSNSEEHRVYMPDSKKDKRRGRKDKNKNDKPDAQPSGTSKPGTTGGETAGQNPPTDTDRPTLKKRPPETNTKTNQEKIDQASETNGQPVLPPDAINDDPNRPHLTRGKPANSPETEPETVALTRNMHALVAVSDPNNKEAHPYRFDFDAREEKSYRDKMIALAGSEAKRARPEIVLPPAAQWQDVNVRAYNLSLDNVATLVLTATIPATGSASERKSRKQAPAANRQQLEQYITLVARVDLEGEVRRTFIQVTDSSRFDMAPRMTLVDAVDADGDGRGELLFRLQSDQGTGWGIYRAGPDELTKLFDTFPAD
ncbi:MAG: hypothetical protein ABI383_14560 [Acidobacteriaceae bacterium]